MIAAVLVAVPSTAFGVGLLESGTRPELSVATRLLYIILFAGIVAVPAAGLVIFHSWLARHSATHSPPGPPGAGSPPEPSRAPGTGRPGPAAPADQARRAARDSLGSDPDPGGATVSTCRAAVTPRAAASLPQRAVNWSGRAGQLGQAVSSAPAPVGQEHWSLLALSETMGP